MFDITPVEVSLWMSVTASKPPCLRCARICSPRIGWPHSTASDTASLPHFLETSNHLSENAPHMQFSTLPVPTRLRTEPSITPHALDVESNTGCVVPKSSFSRGWMPP